MLNGLKNGLQAWLGRRREDTPPARPVSTAPTRESADVHYRQGLAHRQLGQDSDALAAFERAIDIAPDHAAALAAQGGILHEMGRIEEASDAYALALAHAPALSDAWTGYGRLLRDAGQPDEAVRHLRCAVELAPDSGRAWVDLSLALNAAGQTGEAAAACERAIAIAPDDPAAYVNLGLIHLAQLGDAVRAEGLFRKAATLAPALLEPRINIGLALHEQGRSREALAHYDRMLATDPGCVEARWHRGTVRLSLAHFERGWEDYEARKARSGGWPWRVPPPLPEWDGKPLASGALLVYGEQGVGDEIMFASCLPDAIAAVRQCVVQCDARLAALFQRAFPQATVCGAARDDHAAALGVQPRPVVQCAIGSLPRFFRRSEESFAQGSPYLVADRDRVARWQAALGEDTTLKVGVAWRGGTLRTRRELRSTPLAAWQPVLAVEGTRFFGLHRDAAGETAALADSGRRIETLALDSDDLDDMAALMAALDVIITVQGTTAHLAGALGRPVLILLNHSAEWRYLSAGERMPWYRSATLIRQPAPGAWGPVLEDAAARLRQLAADRRAA